MSEPLILGMDFGSQGDTSAITVRNAVGLTATAYEGEVMYEALLRLHDLEAIQPKPSHEALIADIDRYLYHYAGITDNADKLLQRAREALQGER